MRPLFLAFSGLNSYREEQQIDFVKLTAGGIFGIFGPTGSGKSSVLDAMTLALFGKVDRSRKNVQGIINLSEKQCMVDFTFALADKTYRVQRVLKREKDKPFSCKTKSCRFYCADNQDNIKDKASEVNAEIESLLGMKFERFSQAVILPQGKFDAFLRLEPSQRAEFLEQLFHLDEYGDKLSRKASDLLAKFKREKDNCQSRLEMLDDCSAEKAEVLQKNLTEQKVKLAEKEQEVGVLQKEMNALRILFDKSLQLQKTQENLNCLAEQEELQNKLKKQLELAEKAQKLREPIKAAESLHSQINGLEAELLVLRQQVKETQGATEKAKQNLQQVVDVLQKQRQPFLLQIQELGRLLEKETERLGLLEQIKKEQLALQPLLKNEQKILDKQVDLTQKISIAEKAETAFNKQKEKLYVEWQSADQLWRELQKQEMVAHLVSDLHEGSACPVCGALLQEQPQIDSLGADKLEQQRALVEEKQTKWQETQKAADQKAQIVKELQQNLLQQKADLSEVQQRKQSLETLLSEHQKQQVDLQKQVSIVEGDISAKKRELEQKLKKWQADEVTFRAEAERQSELFRQAQGELLSKQGLYDDCKLRFAAVKENLVRDAVAADFANANEAQKNLLTEQERQQIKQDTTEYSDAVKEQKALQVSLQKELLNYNDEQRQLKEVALVEAERGLRQLFSSVALLEAECSKMQKNQALWFDLTQKLTVWQKKENLAHRLTRLFHGKAFVTFLAKDRLESLLWAASDTLAQLSNNRYLLEIFDDGKNSDFMMIDNYNGGGRRPVATLSGGEIFLVSLSLALALSARIQMQGAPLEFFFLDEGFGTLDPARLEMVMSVLEMLPSDKRQVGIISHVQELRNRLPRYLEAAPATDERGSRLLLRGN